MKLPIDLELLDRVLNALHICEAENEYSSLYDAIEKEKNDNSPNAEQIVIEQYERDKAVEAMMECRPWICTSDKQFCYSLYDAGFRRKVIP